MISNSNPPFTCPFCSRPIPNRRNPKCGYCGGPIPEALRIDEAAAQKIQEQRALEQKRFAEHKQDNPDKPTTMNEGAWIIDGLIPFIPED